jgi:2-oxoglutarate dehydrogenase E2 component (dihydrolipoamide succinyltransferase)
MPYKVLMPQLGESVIEGTITKWLKAAGDQVEEFEALLEVNTDKVDSEIPSPASGTILEILIDEGNTVEAGTLLAWIGDSEDEVPAEITSTETISDTNIGLIETQVPDEPAIQNTAASVQPVVGRDRTLGFISPVVAKIASENNVDLFQITGTGKNGRITKNDILNYLDQITEESVTRESGQSIASSGFEILPLSPVRRQIAVHMLRSKSNSPHVTTVMEADLSEVMTHRDQNRELYANDGVNLTFTTYFTAASAMALRNYRIVNSSWSDEGIVIHRDINIGIAASLEEEGLIVPVIRNADGLNLFGLTKRINDLTERARAKKLVTVDVQNGTFTITNHGVNGSLFATPIINQPQCAILGVGVIQKRAVVINDAIAIRPMVYLSLTFDHRIIDGAIADHFLSELIETLQSQWGI